MCDHTRTATIGGKCSDRADFSAALSDGNEIDKWGYAPRLDGFGGGDYIRISFCLDCGIIQGPSFPISDEDISEAAESM